AVPVPAHSCPLNPMKRKGFTPTHATLCSPRRPPRWTSPVYGGGGPPKAVEGANRIGKAHKPRSDFSRRNRPSGSAEGSACAGLFLVYAAKGCLTLSLSAVTSAADGLPSTAR